MTLGPLMSDVTHPHFTIAVKNLSLIHKNKQELALKITKVQTSAPHTFTPCTMALLAAAL